MRFTLALLITRVPTQESVPFRSVPFAPACVCAHARISSTIPPAWTLTWLRTVTSLDSRMPANASLFTEDNRNGRDARSRCLGFVSYRATATSPRLFIHAIAYVEIRLSKRKSRIDRPRAVGISRRTYSLGLCTSELLIIRGNGDDVFKCCSEWRLYDVKREIIFKRRSNIRDIVVISSSNQQLQCTNT